MAIFNIHPARYRLRCLLNLKVPDTQYTTFEVLHYQLHLAWCLYCMLTGAWLGQCGGVAVAGLAGLHAWSGHPKPGQAQEIHKPQGKSDPAYLQVTMHTKLFK